MVVVMASIEEPLVDIAEVIGATTIAMDWTTVVDKIKAAVVAIIEIKLAVMQ